MKRITKILVTGPMVFPIPPIPPMLFILVIIFIVLPAFDWPQAAALAEAPAKRSAVKRGSGSERPLGLDMRLAEAVGHLFMRADAIDEKIAATAGGDGELATVKAIRAAGALPWTKSKIQEVLAVGAIKDKRFRSLLDSYVDEVAKLKRSELKQAVTGSLPKLEAAEIALAAKLREVPDASKERFAMMLAPVFQQTRAAVVQLASRASQNTKSAQAGGVIADRDFHSNQASTLEVAGDTSAKASRTISGTVYYDDIDSLFDDTRAKIDHNFSKFADLSSQGGLNQRLISTPVQAKDANKSMRQSSNATLLQTGQKLGSGYRSGLSNLQRLWQ